MADHNQGTLLHCAARLDARRLDVVCLLGEDFNASVSVVNRFARSLIYEAIRDAECVSYLLDKGVDPNQFKHGTWARLMYASMKNCVDSAKFLLHRGAQTTIKNTDGLTAAAAAAADASVSNSLLTSNSNFIFTIFTQPVRRNTANSAGSMARPDQKNARSELETELKETSRDQLVDAVDESYGADPRLKTHGPPKLMDALLNLGKQAMTPQSQAAKDARTYYSSKKYKRKRWDADKAKRGELDRVLEGIVNMVDESMGHKLSDGKKVIVAIGMGDFSSTQSRHGMFIRYLIQLRPLGYAIVGVNEYFTSKKCPCCQEFVEMPTMKRLYCRGCNKWYHRDVMAADNMVNIVRGYLEHDERPTYLKPPSKDKNTPMKRKADEGGAVDMEGITEQAVLAAQMGAVATSEMVVANMGRASYIGSQSMLGVCDPGAACVVIIVDAVACELESI
ncbi:hypothetical protein SeMB42_g06106 [Synchytrium endobioticum]|uniref:Uncharacterized protein n=1 Tax=Synchytrium endobioticum TaxID=286115 RepID=A0A507CGD6_9FUNG|nr:hypothetical protein SeMB42_g06106 [Synchytrium endobioticum]